MYKLHFCMGNYVNKSIVEQPREFEKVGSENVACKRKKGLYGLSKPQDAVF